MKFSEAMLLGYVQVDGRQCTWTFSDEPGDGMRVCAMGAANLAASGMPNNDCFANELAIFEDAWGIHVKVLNDDLEMPWEHIYGMARAIGL